MTSIFSNLNGSSFVINDGIVFAEGKPLGILCPSSLEAFDEDHEHRIVSGPKGLRKIDATNELDIVQGLVDTGAILFGTDQDIHACKKLLMEPESSRTASYICAIAKNCGDVCQALDNIRNARVVIVGCGGIGALTAFNLAGAGVRTIKLIDNDSIEKSNLNRQFFWRTTDIGKKKVAVLRRELVDRYHGVDIEAYDGKISDADVCDEVQGYDLVVLTADEPLGVGDAKLKGLAGTKAIRLIACGYFHANLSINYICGKNSESWEGRHSWSRNPWFIGPSFGPSNTELAGLASSLCLHALAFPDADHFNQSFVSHWSTIEFPRSARSFFKMEPQ